MSLAPGTRLGPYEVTGSLGAGGMGEVYKAKDTRLDRSVAIKVLPAAFSADPDRRARFEREAKTIAGLNHPHICTLHDVGRDVPTTEAARREGDAAAIEPASPAVDYLVMEMLGGATLADRLTKGPLPLDQAITVATEIADALTAAHRQGVIHRDLKPGNVMLTKTGAKLLDFGLAKLKGHGEQAAAASLASAPTQTRPLTSEGAIVGTLQYMAPEQVEGKPADARTDLWALGAILYEMLTGQRAFQGNSAASLIGNIMNAEPAAMAALQPVTPPALDRLVKRCLAKDPDARWQTASDLAEELRWTRETSGVAAVTGPRRPPRTRRWRRWLPVGVACAVLLVALWVWLRPAEVARTDLEAIPLTAYPGIESQPSFSPDGNKVAFLWDGDKEGNRGIYVTQIGSAGPPRLLTASVGAAPYPAWSPDDRWIAFARNQPEQGNIAVLLIPPLGGPERKLAEMVGVNGLGWSPDGKWLVLGGRDAAHERLGIWAISPETGERRRLTTFVMRALAVQSVLGDTFPSVSPDGRTLAFARQEFDYVSDVYVLPLTADLRPAGEPAKLTDRHYGVVRGLAWTANGREIVYAAGGTSTLSLWRVSIAGRQQPTRLPYVTLEASLPVIAPRTSRLAYAWRIYSENLWRQGTSSGERKMLVSSTYASQHPQYSPDGRKIAFQSNRSGNWEVWTCDADGSNCLQLTSFGGPQCGMPRWSPDGRWIALDSRMTGSSEIYVIAADGGTPRRVTTPAAGVTSYVPSWSPDGRWLYFTSNRSGDDEIWKIPVAGGEGQRVTRDGGNGALASPDGRYIYYVKGTRKPGVFRMPANGGEEQQVVPWPVAWNSFALTSNGVYFRTGRTIQFLDTATGKVSGVADVPESSGGLCVSPDGAYVVWAQGDRRITDLMLVEGFR